MGHWTSRLLVGVVAAWSVLLQPAMAEELHVKVTSKYDDVVQIHFYSYTRDHQWPSEGRSYTLVGDQPQSINLACNPGEQICYGAWVKSDVKINWGVGFGKQRRCTACCYTCDGSAPRITLNP